MLPRPLSMTGEHVRKARYALQAFAAAITPQETLFLLERMEKGQVVGHSYVVQGNRCPVGWLAEHRRVSYPKVWHSLQRKLGKENLMSVEAWFVGVKAGHTPTNNFRLQEAKTCLQRVVERQLAA